MRWFNRDGRGAPETIDDFKFPWKASVLPTLGLVLAVFVVFNLSSEVTDLSLDALAGAVAGSSNWAQVFLEHHRGLISELQSEVVYIASFFCMFGLFKLTMRGKGSTLKLMGAGFDKLKGNLLMLLGIGICGCLADKILESALYSFVTLPTPDSPAVDFADTLSGLAWALTALSATFLAPVLEEIIARGFVLNVLRASLRNGWLGSLSVVAADYTAIVISAASFAAMHMTVSGFPELFISGLVLAWVYRRTNNLYASMSVHLLMNGTASLIMLFGN